MAAASTPSRNPASATRVTRKTPLITTRSGRTRGPKPMATAVQDSEDLERAALLRKASSQYEPPTQRKISPVSSPDVKKSQTTATARNTARPSGTMVLEDSSALADWPNRSAAAW